MLKRKSAVLLRAARETGGHDPYVSALLEAGIDSTCIPVLSFNFVNIEKLSHAIHHPQDYSGIIFTSQRAVEAVDRAKRYLGDKLSDTKGIFSDWSRLPTYVVGMATAEAAEKIGFQTIGKESGNAENLADIIVKNSDKLKKPYLFPCGNLRKETLPKRLSAEGISFENITVYETVPDPNLEAHIDDYFKNITPEFIIFFSPSAVQFTKNRVNLKETFQQIKGGAVIVAHIPLLYGTVTARNTRMFRQGG